MAEILWVGAAILWVEVCEESGAGAGAGMLPEQSEPAAAFPIECPDLRPEPRSLSVRIAALCSLLAGD